MNPKIFARIAESLRQHQRADLSDFEDDVKGKPVDTLYVDPLPSNGILDMVLSSNTTFLLGRKGTGKSTIFARAQSEIRKLGKNISIYVDVKALYELLSGKRQSNPIFFLARGCVTMRQPEMNKEDAHDKVTERPAQSVQYPATLESACACVTAKRPEQS